MFGIFYIFCGGKTRDFCTIPLPRFCRGGFHQPYLTNTNNLDKPAPHHRSPTSTWNLHGIGKCRLVFFVGWGRVFEIVDYWQLWLVNPPLQAPRTLGFRVGWGRVDRIVDYWQLWLVKPAPTVSPKSPDPSNYPNPSTNRLRALSNADCNLLASRPPACAKLGRPPPFPPQI